MRTKTSRTDERPVAPLPGPAHRPALSLPHTTAEKAALCDALLPFLTGLREALWAITARDPGAYPGGDAIYMGQLLLAETRRLLRGERMNHYVAGFEITDDLASRFGLAVKLRAMETAANLFRERYFGYHPSLKRPAWYLCGASAVEDARTLLPRAAALPGEPAPTSADQHRLRNLLAARIEELKRDDSYHADPLPLHRAGGVEVSREVALKGWPGID